MEELPLDRLSREKEAVKTPLDSVLRTGAFWGRAVGIYVAYKGAQAREVLLKARGFDKEYIDTELWEKHHEWAGMNTEVSSV